MKAGEIATGEGVQGADRAFAPQPDSPAAGSRDSGFRRNTSPEGECVHELFERQAQRTPEAVALAFEGHQLTYAELDARANQLAWYLRALGVGPEVVVGIFAERSLEMVVGLMGILKAGGAYLPLDPASPKERSSFMLEDARVTVVLTQQHLADKLPPQRAKVLRLDFDWPEVARLPLTKPASGVTPDHLVYVIYTSGSTGRPKGAMNAHRAVSNVLTWMQDTYHLDTTDVVLQKTPFMFDVSVWEFFWPLMIGSKLVLARPEGHRDPEYLSQLIAAEHVTTLYFVPSMLSAFLESPQTTLDGVRRVFCIGEALSPQLQERYFAQWTAPLFNLYGPTEAAVGVTAWECEPKTRRSTVPIGKPISNVQMYILDEALQQVPVGVSGDLYIGGLAVGRGYLGRPDLTAERFVPDPFGLQAGGRIYRTGDLARYLADGNIEYLGRADFQVKLRGFRIELGEIEAVLDQYDGAKGSVVVVQEQQQRLIAYLVVSKPESLQPESLRQFLRERLPEYMIPSDFMALTAFPLSPNGKLDRKALPAPQRDPPDADRVAPRNDTEAMIAGIWAEVLNLSRVDSSDNFFSLGGHSLLVIQVLSRLQKAFDVRLPFEVFFKHPTVSALAEQVVRLRGGTTPPSSPPLERIPRKELLSPSCAQDGLWFLDRMTGGGSAYNVWHSLRLEGPLSVHALDEALVALVERHEALRTVFREVDGKPFQVILPSGSVRLEVEDLSTFEAEQADQEARRIAAREANRPFDLAKGPLLRMRLLKLGERSHLLLLSVHHIIVDQWSINIFWEELSELYRGALEGRIPALRELPLQYVDFAAWQRSLMDNPEFAAQVEDLKRKLEGRPTSLGLLTDFPRPAVKTYRGRSFRFELSPHLALQLIAFSRREGFTLHVTLISLYAVLLHRYSRQDDILLMYPSANRGRVELEGIFGCFVNTLILRTDLSDRPSFLDLARRVQRWILKGQDHHEIPFDKLVEALSPERDLSRTPLAQTMFVMTHATGEAFDLPEVTTSKVDLRDHETAKFDLTLSIEATEAHGFKGALEYSTDLFLPETIERMVGHFVRLIEEIVENPERRIDDLPMLTTTETRRQLVEWNQTDTSSSQNACVHELFERQAQRTPKAIAIAFEGRTLTYAELDARANQLARHLRMLGTDPEVLVGVFADRSLEMVVGLMGILKAGGAYLPLDPSSPRERLSVMLEDARVTIVLTQEHLTDKLPLSQTKVLRLDVDWPEVARQPTTKPPSSVTPDHLAYVIYTSGSTGRPKGAMNAHRAVSNVLTWMQDTYHLDATDAVLQKTPYTFDVSVWEFFLPLMTGAKLVLTRPEGHRDPEYLSRLIAAEHVTALHFVPSMLSAFLESPQTSLDGVRWVFSGGETLTVQLQKRYFERVSATLYNRYGPTETAVDVTAWKCEPKTRRSTVPIGKPIANVQTYILDEALQPVPVGVSGDLYIGGLAVGRGYLGRPDLTAEKFIPDPFGSQPGGRLYRTGDVARYLADGNIDYLGRADFQVKLRGFRIELGEIEATLDQYEGVQKCVGILQEQEQRLIAYLVVSNPETLQPDLLRRYLRERLPEYMIPSQFVALSEFPLSPNGKLDRRALPAPQREPSDGDRVAPRNDTEAMIADIWAEVLNRSHVGLSDNFFSLGGHSLLVMQVLSRLQRAFGVRLPFEVFFKHPTVSALAEQVIWLRSKTTPVSFHALRRIPREGPLVPSYVQERFWFLEQLNPGTPTYHCPFNFHLRGELSEPALQRALQGLVDRHEALRTVFNASEGRLFQIVLPRLQIPLEVEDFSAIESAERPTALQRSAEEEAHRPFNWERGPLLRAKLARIGRHEHVLLLTLHHVIIDRWSEAILWNELVELYRAIIEQRAARLPELSVQYPDFASWQRARMQAGEFAKQLNHWTQRLEDAPASPNLPTDFRRPPIMRFRGNRIQFEIPTSVAERLKQLGRAEGATLFMTLCAAFDVLLHRYTGQTEILVSTVTSNRGRVELEAVVGCFVNTLPLRVRADGVSSFREVLRRAKEAMLEAQENQDLPFEQVVAAVRSERDLSRSELAQIAIVLQNKLETSQIVPGLTASPFEVDLHTAKFELTLHLSETGAGPIEAMMEYDTDLFTSETIRRMADHYLGLLRAATDEPDARISDLPLLTEQETRRLSDWNETGVAFFRDQTVQALIEQRAKEAPQAVALVFKGQTLTYQELDARANQLAHHLRKRGVGPEVLVGIFLDRSLEMVVSLLGVLKSGGAYLPLDTTHPAQRLAFLLKDSGCDLVVTRKQMSVSLPTTAHLVDIDTDLQHESRQGIPSLTAPASLAYVIYTSGSTGNPKGTLITHGSLSNYVGWYAELAQLRPGDRVLQFSKLSFDASVEQIFPTLARGATLVLPEEVGLTPEAFFAECARETLTVLPLPTAYWRELASWIGEQRAALPADVRLVTIAGEAADPELVNAWIARFPNRRLVNVYGPTEATVGSTGCELNQTTLDGKRDHVPIGKPIASATARVLDRELQQVPIGVVGELFLGGTGLARGYLGRSDLTAERFVPDPFHPTAGSRMYRTGDLARFRVDGQIEYLGRLDDQVKIRGFRIELREIEHALKESIEVRDVFVVALSTKGQGPRLVAYLVPHDNRAVPPAPALTAILRERLPDYMVPAAFIVLAKLPLTGNGKIDRKALPPPDLESATREYSAPTNATETLLATIWAEVLGVDRVGVNESFFALGGHSLLAMQVAARLRTQLHVDVPVRMVFERPTIAELAKAILNLQPTGSAPALGQITRLPRRPK